LPPEPLKIRKSAPVLYNTDVNSETAIESPNLALNGGLEKEWNFVKVCDLFSLNREFRNFEVVCGESGLSNNIKNVVTVEVTDTFRWLQPGDFAITKGYFSQKGKISFVSFVEMLIEKKAAGLGIKLGIFISKLPPEVLSLANDNQFPILSVPASIKYATIVPSILHRLSSKKQYAQYVLNTFQNDLNQLMKSMHRVTDIVDLLAAYIGYPVCAFWGKNFQWIIPQELSAAEKAKNMKKWVMENKASFAMGNSPLWYVSGNDRFVIFNISNVSEIVAFLAVDIGGKTLTSVDSQLIAKIIPVICVHLLSGINEIALPPESVDDLLAKTLFDKDELDLRQIRLDVGRVQLDYRAERRVWILETPQIAPKERDDLENAVFEAVKPISLSTYHTQRDERLVFVSQFEALQGNMDHLRDFFLGLLKGLPERLAALPIHIGVSMTCFDFGDLRQGYQDADFSLRRGKKLRLKPEIYFFESFILVKILSEMWNNPILQKLHADVIERLTRNDGLKNTELLKTLAALSYSDFNITAVAKNMYLHRNTVSQRIEKINGILKLDVNDVKNRLMIQMAVKLLEL
jgi:purine catabolism regulator